MSNRNFLVGGTATFAVVLLVLVSLFAAFKSTPKVQGRPSLNAFPASTSKADGPYASVEHFCGGVNSCSILG